MKRDRLRAAAERSPQLMPYIIESPASPAGQERGGQADPANHTAPHVQAEVEATTSAPAAGNSHAASAVRDLGALGRYALPEFVDLEDDDAPDTYQAAVDLAGALKGLSRRERRLVLAFALELDQ
jgi:hypothetical protein